MPTKSNGPSKYKGQNKNNNWFYCAIVSTSGDRIQHTTWSEMCMKYLSYFIVINL